MNKLLRSENCLYPSLVVIVGANVNGKPNFLTVAWIGILGHNTIGMGLNKSHYTNKGIKENETFSLNIPSENMVKETDFVGLVSGKNHDKSNIFKVFNSKLLSVPMVEECPINMECKLVSIVDNGSHDIFIGNIVQTYCSPNVLIDNNVDLSKVHPLLFSMYEPGFWSLGNFVAKAWDVGKELKK